MVDPLYGDDLRLPCAHVHCSTGVGCGHQGSEQVGMSSQDAVQAHIAVKARFDAIKCCIRMNTSQDIAWDDCNMSSPFMLLHK
jgi:hypothetical protein